MKQQMVRVWVCPEEDCQNYYGSSSQAPLDLGAELNLESDMRHGVDHDPSNPKVTGNRGQCPDCKARGRKVQRVSVVAVLNVPAPAAVTS